MDLLLGELSREIFSRVRILWLGSIIIWGILCGWGGGYNGINSKLGEYHQEKFQMWKFTAGETFCP